MPSPAAQPGRPGSSPALSGMTDEHDLVPPTPPDLSLDGTHGDRGALDQMLPLVYAELRRLAAHYLSREREGHTLQPTALVHEAYLKLVDKRPDRWQGRAHFYGVAARCMREVLVDAARTRRAAKRGGGALPITLSGAEESVIAPAEVAGDDVLALDEALTRLAQLDPDQARLVELRYFAGLTLDDTAATLGVSPATVSREWTVARRWLRRELARGGVPVRRSSEAAR